MGREGRPLAPPEMQEFGGRVLAAVQDAPMARREARDDVVFSAHLHFWYENGLVREDRQPHDGAPRAEMLEYAARTRNLAIVRD